MTKIPGVFFFCTVFLLCLLATGDSTFAQTADTSAEMPETPDIATTTQPKDTEKTPQSAAEEVKKLADPPSLTGAALQMTGGLFLILALLCVAVWCMKRFGVPPGLRGLRREELKLEGHLSLGPKRSLVVVRFLNRQLLLGVSEAGISLLTEEQTGHTHNDTNDFTTSLQEARKERDRLEAPAADTSV